MQMDNQLLISANSNCKNIAYAIEVTESDPQTAFQPLNNALREKGNPVTGLLFTAQELEWYQLFMVYFRLSLEMARMSTKSHVIQENG